jgi:flagellar basal body P-ring formation protein FlgA
MASIRDSCAHIMKLIASFATLIGGLLLTVAFAAQATTQSPQQPRQDEGALRKAVEQFLRTQTVGLPGEIGISVGPIDPRLYLTSCPNLEAFLPIGNKAWGKTTVGIRCSEPAHWTIYISATIHAIGEYVAAVGALAQGQVVGPHDVALVHGDLTSLPPGVVTELSQAVGLSVARSVPAGMPVRQDALRNQLAVQEGQVVRLVSIGEGFRVSAEGRALTNAADGQIAQAKNASGQVVSGIARTGGSLEVSY